MATRNNHLDLALDQIADPAARQALSSLVDFVNGIAGKGIDTQGSVKAEGGLETARGGVFKTKVYSGALATNGTDGDSRVLTVPGLILGVIGYCQVEAGSSDWMVIVDGATSPSSIQFQHYGLQDRIEITNETADDNLGFRVIIFYTDKLA